jgi:Domain of unknown function(DUF2779)
MSLLTKSRYKLASDCPRKLYYQAHPERYANQSVEDDFLSTLADGGYQVAALARTLYPNGVMVETLDSEQACRETAALLQQTEITIFEAAIRFEKFLIRVDILRKTSNGIELIEVKSASWDSTPGKDSLLKKNDEIKSEWIPYVEDVAFQTWVARQAGIGSVITPFLMLVDKASVVEDDGLHQLFRVRHDDGRTRVDISDGVLAEKLGRRVLCLVPVGDQVEAMISGTANIPAEIPEGYGQSLPERARFFANILTRNKPFPATPPIGMRCKKCEFRSNSMSESQGHKSGFDQCWTERLAKRHNPVRLPLFNLWNLRAEAGNSLMDEGIFYLDELQSVKINQIHVRQERQLASVREGNPKEEIDAGLRPIMADWKYPLHFLDFETTTPSLPFHKGLKPYQMMGFQFSCHHLHADGTITHDEFLAADPRTFPSYRFIIALKKVLGNDEGTIFRYSPHENTVLRQLRQQLVDSVADQTGILQPIPAEMQADEMLQWIDHITTASGKESGGVGPRSMVDLLPLVKEHYYHPHMGGSNSIKYVLPAVMAASAWLRDVYSKPLSFGTNLVGQILWQQSEGGTPKDPYDLLPPIFDGFSHAQLEGDDNDQQLQNGGAAMKAYASLQYTEMPTEKRQALIKALLRYCELDTLAMLMIYQHWKQKKK